jgi:hypothetical protein
MCLHIKLHELPFAFHSDITLFPFYCRSLSRPFARRFYVFFMSLPFPLLLDLLERETKIPAQQQLIFSYTHTHQLDGRV